MFWTVSLYLLTVEKKNAVMCYKSWECFDLRMLLQGITDPEVCGALLHASWVLSDQNPIFFITDTSAPPGSQHESLSGISSCN